MNLKKQAGSYRKMGVEKCKDRVTFTFQCPKETACAVLLYDKRTKKLAERLEVPEQFCVGSVRSMTVFPLKTERFYYGYEIDGKVIRDPFGEVVIGREKWGDSERDPREEQLLSGFNVEEFDWGDTCPPEIGPQDMVMYKLHVRGFSMDGKGRKKGTFEALQSRLSYLEELGVTTIEVMPVYEFEEIMVPAGEEQEIKLNYWGYCKSDYFAVKSSYASGDACLEFKSLMREVHSRGMELVMEMHFGPEQNAGFIVKVLRHWVLEYRVDGFKLIGAALPMEEIAADPYLSRTKLFYESFSAELSEEGYQNLYVYNEEFLYPMRKMLNHLGGDLLEFTKQLKKSHPFQHYVNYLSNSNTFTLADIFSYNEKHNGANGEENLDGNDWNYSSNYGMEGPSRKQFIKKIRRKQMRNAAALLFLAKGIPLLWSGDEIGNSQGGNNNAYCQDNKTGWVNWKNSGPYSDYTQFIREMIAFRKEHPVLSMNEAIRMCDYQQIGYPDLSYHGAEAWIRGISASSRSIGMMYCEAYAQDEGEEKKEDTFLYIGYNFYMGLQIFALPKLPKGRHWYLVMDTGEEKPFFEKPQRLDKNFYEAFGQTISILIGR